MAKFTEFVRQWNAIEEAVPKEVTKLQEKMVVAGLGNVSVMSPVRSGAYRAEHLIEVGSGDHVSRRLYENEDRIGPDTPTPEDYDAPIKAPSLGEAQSNVEGQLEPYGSVQVANRRFYSVIVEDAYGYKVYERGAQALEAIYDGADIELPVK